MATLYRNLEERIIANTVLSEDTSFGGTPCWIWIGRRDGKEGYGRINMRINGRHVTRAAHRVAYEELVGPIPEGYELDHRCYVPLCCNPSHLEPVLGMVNNQRKRAR